MAEIKSIRARVEDEREARKTGRKDLGNIVLTDATKSGAVEVEKALEEGDIATARESSALAPARQADANRPRRRCTRGI